jgi:hypothetical protein
VQTPIIIPSRDNIGSYTVEVGIEVECTSDDFDVRFGEFTLEPELVLSSLYTYWSQVSNRNPSSSAQAKRDLHAKEQMMVHPDLAIIHKRDDTEPLEARQVPAIPEQSITSIVPAAGSTSIIKQSSAASQSGLQDTVPALALSQVAPALPVGNVIPTIAASNAAPALSKTQALPDLDPANAAPTLSPNLQAPAFSYVPGVDLVRGTYTLGAAVPTATAIYIGDTTYDFPAFDDVMASATGGAVGAAPTTVSGEPYTGWTTLDNMDPRQSQTLAAAEDGNFYMVPKDDVSSPGTLFYSDNSVAYKDEGDRMFHYYPDTMALYGISRLRVSQVMDTPLNAQLITLVPVATNNGTAYVAADTDGHNYLLAWCTAPRWDGSKIFLVNDYTHGLPTLLSGEVQWIVTGNNVTECNPLVLTSKAGGLSPIP